jgi:Beta-lactamase enzyme family
VPGEEDTAELLRRCRESDRRSRERRTAGPPRRRARVRGLLWVAAVVAVGVWVKAESPISPAGPPTARAVLSEPAPGLLRVAVRSPATVPSPAAMRDAWRFARRRGGAASIAVIDTHGRLRGRAAGREYPSASVVKAMLLAAELRRLRRDGLELDGGTRHLLAAMITRSDNDSADAIYARVRDAGLRDVATAAGMRRFRIAASWGYARITAADLARFFAQVGKVVPPRHRRMALGLLRSLTPEHRWGLPRAARGRWTVHAKGGWRETGTGQLVHQAALLRKGRRKLSVAILTDGQPSHLYGVHTVRGIANRLLRGQTP